MSRLGRQLRDASGESGRGQAFVGLIRCSKDGSGGNEGGDSIRVAGSSCHTAGRLGVQGEACTGMERVLNWGKQQCAGTH